MPCQNKGTCMDKIAGYECICPAGYSGENCELFVCDGVTCAPFSECKEHKNGYRCVCKTGYTGELSNYR